MSSGEQVGRLIGADNGRDAQLTSDDGRMAGAPPAVGNNRRRFLHDRFPVRVSDVGDEYFTGLEIANMGDGRDDTRRANGDLITDGQPFD